MGRIQVALSLVAMVGAVAACDALSSKQSGDDESADDASKKKKKNNKKDSDKDGADDAKATEQTDIDVNALFGKDATFGGSLDDYGEVMFGAVGHSAIEPDNFSAGWVGKESWDVLQRARKGEFVHSQVRTSDGRVCLVFKEGSTVRRAMLASTRQSPTEELAFAANGNLIFWYRHNRNPQDTFEDWAYFHRGNNLMLYQTRRTGGARQADMASDALRNHILSGASQCIQSSGAGNPLPGSAPPPLPAPATPPPQGGGNASGGTGLHFGAFAYSNSAVSWTVSYRSVSEEEARKQALAACQQSDCEVRTVFKKGECLSVVHGPAPFVAWSWGADNNSTQTSALAECTKAGHPAASCESKGTWCNDG